MTDSPDPFAPLKTWEGATPGPWDTQVYSDAMGVGHTCGQPWMLRRVAKCDVGMPEEMADARHIATWDPDTCREVVALLELAEAHLHPTFGAWHERLDALLTRLAKETP